ncbi:hypothetical protein THICB2_630006 [Thiomonas sp. CB2]|nr:hypothetical protein THICB2_630006 [Thiomonas sp. CB2]
MPGAVRGFPALLLCRDLRVVPTHPAPFLEPKMRLIIAEKPSVAQAIAGVIGGAKRSDGYIDCPQAKTRVTWCFGHLLEQAKPEDYVAGGKVLASHLPVIPTDWKLSPRDGGASKQASQGDPRSAKRSRRGRQRR